MLVSQVWNSLLLYIKSRFLCTTVEFSYAAWEIGITQLEGEGEGEGEA